MKPAASKPASTEHLREFHLEQDAEKQNTQEQQIRFLLWLDTLAYLTFIFIVLITTCIFQVKNNDRKI